MASPSREKKEKSGSDTEMDKYVQLTFCFPSSFANRSIGNAMLIF